MISEPYFYGFQALIHGGTLIRSSRFYTFLNTSKIPLEAPVVDDPDVTESRGSDRGRPNKGRAQEHELSWASHAGFAKACLKFLMLECLSGFPP